MSEVGKFREEWTVAHSQGIHPGPFTRKAAEEWIVQNKKADGRRQTAYRGRQRLLRRLVTDWEEVPMSTTEERA